ncbi:hypothetical protein RhiirA5_446561 [Rhizophagus irregularis]|uniref:Uncharacterized protein n=1 Tax=Rhizophagus irregularis TaxID=588596 RepID=A0A2N0NBN0_9GLOM|nr:hypothetical protein RhiirA5_446561 [Rhizophagus irregularis]
MSPADLRRSASQKISRCTAVALGFRERCRADTSKFALDNSAISGKCLTDLSLSKEKWDISDEQRLHFVTELGVCRGIMTEGQIEEIGTWGADTIGKITLIKEEDKDFFVIA